MMGPLFALTLAPFTCCAVDASGTVQLLWVLLNALCSMWLDSRLSSL
jgi:hypothetical protein